MFRLPVPLRKDVISVMTTSGLSGISPVLSPIPVTSATRAEHPERVESAPQSKYDSVDLSPAPEGERRFVMDTVSRLANEVRTAKTTGDIQALTAQVHSGQYQPDAMAIASKMLLLGDI